MDTPGATDSVYQFEGKSYSVQVAIYSGPNIFLLFRQHCSFEIVLILPSLYEFCVTFENKFSDKIFKSLVLSRLLIDLILFTQVRITERSRR